MKPTNKKNAQNMKQKGESKSTKKIDSYFGSAPKPFVIEKIGDPESTKTFFVQTLNELLENDASKPVPVQAKRKTAKENVDEDGGNGDNGSDNGRYNGGACASVLENKNKGLEKSDECAGCVEKQSQLMNWETKYKALEKVYLNQCHHFSELTIKHNVLVSTKVNYSVPDPDANAPEAVNNDIFSKTELKILENVGLEKRKDSTFVHQCLEYVYKNDLTSFSRKTLKGKAESVKFSEDGTETRMPKKDPYTPEKVQRIRDLFVERICKCGTNSANFEDRLKESNFNKLFASSAKNLENKYA